MLLPKLMIDIAGVELTPEDKTLLQHPSVGGVILFSRNFESTDQLIHLTHHIHRICDPPLLIAVDHEGGRVQRFHQGFTALPAMRTLGLLYDQRHEQAVQKAEHIGWTMGSELRAVGIDCSFAPVVDLDNGISEVIGDRSFHHDPCIVGKLACAVVRGMHKAGLMAVGKHFPGHGHVVADSHSAVPIDDRDFQQIAQRDLLPFQALIDAGIDGIMPAHVIYSKIDDKPANFSPFWLKTQLKQTMRFQGTIFSDDLSMAGASPIGDMLARVQHAKRAGCDMLLICNHRTAVIEVIQHEHS